MKLGRSVALSLVGFACVCFGGHTQADCHKVVVRRLNAVAYQPFYGAYNFQVGAQLQVDSQQARDERIANLVVQKLQAAQLQAPQVLQQSAPDRWSLVRQWCVKCHAETNEKAIAHLSMHDLDALTCEEKVVMAKNVLDGKMPPNKPLPPEVLGNLLGQIVGAETAPGYSPQAVAEPQRMDFQVQAEPEVAPEPPARHYGIPPTTGIGGPEVAEVSVGDVSESSVTIAWFAPDDSFVRVELMATGKSPYNNYDAKSPLSITGLKPGKTYVYLVQAKDAQGKVGVAASGKFTTSSQTQQLESADVPPPNPEPESQ